MKTSIRTFVIAFVILGSAVFTINAEGVEGKGGKKAAKKDNQYSYQAAINLHHGNLVAVQFMKPSDQKVTVTIKNEQGKIVHHESIKKHDLLVKKYNLDAFPHGTYQVIVKNGDAVTKKAITIK